MSLPRRKHARLANHDYREAGAYYVTVCVARRLPILSRVREDGVVHTPPGDLVLCAWESIPSHHAHVAADAFVVMPDHVHGILLFGPDLADLIEREGDLQARHAGSGGLRSGSLGAVVRGFKSASSRAINRMAESPGAPVWQRGYWDRVLRDEDELARAREYILANPQRWWQSEHPDTDEP